MTARGQPGGPPPWSSPEAAKAARLTRQEQLSEPPYFGGPPRTKKEQLERMGTLRWAWGSGFFGPGVSPRDSDEGAQLDSLRRAIENLSSPRLRPLQQHLEATVKFCTSRGRHQRAANVALHQAQQNGWRPLSARDMALLAIECGLEAPCANEAEWLDVQLPAWKRRRARSRTT